MSTQFYDSNVTTVDYQIIFTKRDYEAILDKGSAAVTKSMTSSGFAAWKIAEFIREADAKGFHRRPSDWSREDFEFLTEVPKGGSVRRLKRENLEYLQVQYQVLSTLDRQMPEYDKDKVAALNTIASNTATGGGAPPPAPSPGGPVKVTIDELPTSPGASGTLYYDSATDKVEISP